MTEKTLAVAVQHFEGLIRLRRIRGQKVMLDSDLARVYGVTTSRLNEAVKRNRDRFPEDFMFQLTRQEFTDLMSQIAISSSRHGGRRKLPYAFTEHGAIMAANVLSSPRAVQMSPPQADRAGLCADARGAQRHPRTGAQAGRARAGTQAASRHPRGDHRGHPPAHHEPHRPATFARTQTSPHRTPRQRQRRRRDNREGNDEGHIPAPQQIALDKWLIGL